MSNTRAEATAKKYEQEAKDLQKELEDTKTGTADHPHDVSPFVASVKHHSRKGIEKRKVDVAKLEETQKQLHVLSKEIEASAEARAQEGRKAVALKMKDHQDAEMVGHIFAGRRISRSDLIVFTVPP